MQNNTLNNYINESNNRIRYLQWKYGMLEQKISKNSSVALTKRMRYLFIWFV